MFHDYIHQKERAVVKSVVASPCAGPTNLVALSQIEHADALLEKLHSTREDVGDMNDVDDVLNQMLGLIKSSSSSSSGGRSKPQLRLLYIPTAMYAIRKDSNSTPGKQRQRSRADGKKRRDRILQTLHALVNGSAVGDDYGQQKIKVLAVTMDLDDGSIKQPFGSNKARDFPRDGKEAFKSWSPHIIYVEGGNTFWLQHCINLGDWDVYLKNACTGPNCAIYCGTSAGAIIAGSFVETATWKGWDDPSIIPGMEQPEDWKRVPGMGLVGMNVAIFPHMSDGWIELVNGRKSEIDGTVLCLSEYDACCIDGRKAEFHIVSAMVLERKM